MEQEQKITNDIKVPNKDMEVLKKHFGQCFDKEGAFDLEKFKHQLSQKEVDFSKESYGLDWLGKAYARLLASDEATTLLKEDEAFNQQEANITSENLLIKGDNLEVLKHLSNAYYEKIKMIYIDPPYNTGSDGFVYNDDRKFSVSQLRQLAGVDEEKAKRILAFTQSSSNSHSAWLTFMYPRLYIARRLLREDGVIFISIDDNEVAQLRLMMDEIFGEENFLGPIIQNKLNSKNDSINIQKNHEFIISYRKAISTTNLGQIKASIEKRNFTTKEVFRENDTFYLLNDPITTRGDGGTLNSRKNLGYTVYYNPDSGDFMGLDDYDIELAQESNDESEIYFDNEDLLSQGYIIIRPPKVRGKLGAWTWELTAFNNKKKEILIKQTKNGYSVRKRTFLNNPELIFEKGKYYTVVEEIGNSRSIIDYSTNEGSIQLNSVIGTDGVFSNPKNINLLKYITSLVPDNNYLMLDFFAGSGSTAEAIMQLNAEDGGNRKYILVQLPEVIDPKSSKAAYDFVKDELGVAEPTIFEITQERLLRAAKKIQEETIALKIKEKEKEIGNLNSELDLDNKTEKIDQLQQEITNLQHQDLGFKVFETMPIWEDYNLEANEYTAQTELFDESKLTQEDIKALLITWKTNDGLLLTENLESVKLGNYEAQYGNGKLYLMHKGFETDTLKALLEKIDTDKAFNPTSIIAFGYHFESKSLREISENIKSYANKKNIDIDFITRY